MKYCVLHQTPTSRAPNSEREWNISILQVNCKPPKSVTLEAKMSNFRLNEQNILNTLCSRGSSVRFRIPFNVKHNLTGTLFAQSKLMYICWMVKESFLIVPYTCRIIGSCSDSEVQTLIQWWLAKTKDTLSSWDLVQHYLQFMKYPVAWSPQETSCILFASYYIFSANYLYVKVVY